MLARIRKQLEEREDKGFTLVELLVVIIIIGILAAIAIPLYLNQQQKAKDSALKSDLKNAQIEVANQLVDDPTGATVDQASVEAAVSLSPGVAVSAFNLDLPNAAFEICGTVVGGTALGTAGICIDEAGALTDTAGNPI